MKYKKRVDELCSAPECMFFDSWGLTDCNGNLWHACRFHPSGAKLENTRHWCYRHSALTEDDDERIIKEIREQVEALTVAINKWVDEYNRINKMVPLERGKG